MPRRPRVVVPGQPHHVLQRGNNRQAIFYSETDYLTFLDALHAACERYGCAVHAYVLMTNHVHLLMTPESDEGLSRVMQSIGRRYVRYVNDTYRRTGTLWEGRFKCSVVDTLDYLWRCFVYIEMNPVRAGMVRAPQEYRWSSFRANGLGQADTLLTAHELYEGLGGDAIARRRAYRALFAGHLDPDTLENMRDAIDNDLPLGGSHFRRQIESALQRRIEPYSHGGDRRSEAFRAGGLSGQAKRGMK